MTEIAMRLGKTYLYELTTDNAQQINLRRQGTQQTHTAQWPEGAQAHVGNYVQEGDIFPLVVTKEWPDGLVNGQVLLDGSDTLWVTSVKVDERLVVS
jgi:hypothetical protein